MVTSAPPGTWVEISGSAGVDFAASSPMVAPLTGMNPAVVDGPARRQRP
jgi:hypothetical protein